MEHMSETETPNLPGISAREFIRWIPDSASEPTSTLVLTSAARRFIDIRIFKPKTGEPELPNDGGPLSRLEWAFAGISSTTEIPSTEPGGKTGLHSQWTHWIDSRTDGPVKDEGDMFQQPDGLHTLECGEMINPETGKLTEYEELWVDEEPEITQAMTEGGQGHKGKKWSVVLTLDDAANGAKGMVVRVGHWCQGIIKVQGELSSERWRWTGEDGPNGKESAGWKRVAKIGRLFVPCALTFEPERVMVGSLLDYGDYKWEVREVFGW